MTISDLKEQFLELKFRKKVSDENLVSIKEEGKKIVSKKKKYEKASELIRLCIEKSLDNRKYIEVVIDEGVKSIFGENYTFRYEDSRNKDQTLKGVKLVLEKDGIVFYNIRDGCGDALADVLDNMHRVIFADYNPDCAPFLVMDEPLSSADIHTADRYLDWLENYCITNNFQVIMTSHHKVKSGKIIEVVMNNGNSTVNEVTT